MGHCPVLLKESLHWLAPVDGGVYVDGNLGLGGHSTAILEQSGPGGQVIGFEWDGEAIERARVNLALYGSRVTFIRRNFADVGDVLQELEIQGVNGLLLDLGMSSLQLEHSGRGFSFKGEEPLDMRMDDRGRITAADVLNDKDEVELADIFYYYGGERQARRIAASVVHDRRQEKIVSTGQLANLVYQAIPKRFHPKKIHVATKVFQALRIAVNRELDNLEKILNQIADILLPGGRVCIISFHSLEDRLVKYSFRENPALKVLTGRGISSGEQEIRENPRSRSARLRVAVRL